MQIKKTVIATTIAFMAFAGWAAGMMAAGLVTASAGREGVIVVATLAGLGMFATGTLAFLGVMVAYGHIKINMVE